MDKALVYGTRDSGFDPQQQGRYWFLLFFPPLMISGVIHCTPSPLAAKQGSKSFIRNIFLGCPRALLVLEFQFTYQFWIQQFQPEIRGD